MGLYLLIIATVDVYYRGQYFLYDDYWRNSVLCQLAGFISTLSSELSVLTLTVITLDRFISISCPECNSGEDMYMKYKDDRKIGCFWTCQRKNKKSGRVCSHQINPLTNKWFDKAHLTYMQCLQVAKTVALVATKV